MATRGQKRQMTNVEFVTHMMEYSDFGALAQMFIVDAITKHADRIAEMSLSDLKAAFGENGLISAQAWHGVAKEIKRKLEEQYGRK